MNSAIELHDSSLETISYTESSIDVELWCGLYMSSGRPIQNAGFAAVQGMVFSFEAGCIDGDVGDLPAEILKGELHVGAVLHSNIINLPCVVSGEAVSLTLFLHPDYRRVVISGTGLAVTLLGEPERVSEYQPRTANG